MIFESMNYNEKLLFYLLSKGLKTQYSCDTFVFSEKPDWNFIYNKSVDQGVLAFVYDGVISLMENHEIPENLQMTRMLKLQWASNVTRIEQIYERQYKLSNELADVYAEHNIKTVVLKGIALAQLYPKQNHRSCGDFDCFLMGKYDEGNKIASGLGADVDADIPKHSHIVYKGLMVENHKNFSYVSKNKRNNQFEFTLHKIINKNNLIAINNTNLLSPDSLFTALFLTDHSHRHFIYGKVNSNIKLRHLCDWAMFLKYYYDKTDWSEFRRVVNIKDKKMLSFAECISIISHKVLGVPLPDDIVEDDSSLSLSKELLYCILYNNNSRELKCEGKFERKYRILKESLFGNWREINFNENPPLSLRKLHRTARLILSDLKFKSLI